MLVTRMSSSFLLTDGVISSETEEPTIRCKKKTLTAIPSSVIISSALSNRSSTSNILLSLNIYLTNKEHISNEVTALLSDFNSEKCNNNVK